MGISEKIYYMTKRQFDVFYFVLVVGLVGLTATVLYVQHLVVEEQEPTPVVTHTSQ